MVIPNNLCVSSRDSILDGQAKNFVRHILETVDGMTADGLELNPDQIKAVDRELLQQICSAPDSPPAIEIDISYWTGRYDVLIANAYEQQAMSLEPASHSLVATEHGVTAVHYFIVTEHKVVAVQGAE